MMISRSDRRGVMHKIVNDTQILFISSTNPGVKPSLCALFRASQLCYSWKKERKILGFITAMKVDDGLKKFDNFRSKVKRFFVWFWLRASRRKLKCFGMRVMVWVLSLLLFALQIWFKTKTSGQFSHLMPAASR